MGNILYKKNYTNKYFAINLFTNSKMILKFINNFLDFNGKCPLRPKIKIDFYFKQVNLKERDGRKGLFSRDCGSRNKKLLFYIGDMAAVVKTNPKKRIVKASVFGPKEIYKNNLINFIFLKPLRFILAHYGLFALHASAVSKNGNAIIITGDMDAGKSITALVLSRAGFNILTDDKLFVKSIGGKTKLCPLPTKMGLNDKFLNRFPRFNRYIIKNYRYGKKRRLSLKHLICDANNIEEVNCSAILFPVYKSNSRVSMIEISKKEALGRLLKNIPKELLKRGSEEMLSRNFWVFYNLTREVKAFKLVYNDDRLDEIPGIVNKQFKPLASGSNEKL